MDNQPTTDVDVRIGGRPRDQARGAAILQATLTMLAEVGYDRLSVEAIATRAGVAKTTIYRRWSDKPRLVAAAVATHVVELSAPPENGDLRTAALAMVTDLARHMAEQDVALFAALATARRTDAILAKALVRTLDRDRATMTIPLMQAAQRNDQELRPDAAHLIAELVPALLLHRLLVLDHVLDFTDIEYLVDRMLLPLIVAC